MAIAALILSIISICWQVISYFVAKRDRRLEVLEQRQHELAQEREAEETKHRQVLKGFVDYLGDVRSLNQPPQRSGAPLWHRAATRLRRTRQRLVETVGRMPPDHPSMIYLDPLTDAFHDWADVWDYYEDLAGTAIGETALMEALAELQAARWAAEDSMRERFALGERPSRTALTDDFLPLAGKRH